MFHKPDSRWRWAALLLAGLACRFPDPPALQGKVCQTDGDCDGQLLCRERLCETDKPAFPVRAAFYQLHFPEEWSTHDESLLGHYLSEDPSVMAAHFNALAYGNITAGIVVWDGRQGLADLRMEKLLMNTRSHLFRWSVEHVGEGVGNPAVGALTEDLARIRALLTESPHGWRVEGRPVLFVRSSPNDSCELLNRWARANTEEPVLQLVVQVFEGWEACNRDLPYSWYPREATTGLSWVAGFSAVIRPGIWPQHSEQETLARDSGRFETDLEAMKASGVKLQLIRSFNDWEQGTAVEPGPRWQSISRFGVYLDLLHR